MSQKTRAFRALADLALSSSYDDVVYPSIDALSVRTGVPRSTVGRAVHTLCERGAAEWTSGSRELILCSKPRAVDSYKTLWDRQRALIGYVSEGTAEDLVSAKSAVWGGHRAAIAHLNGYVAASPYTASIYVLGQTAVNTRPHGDVPVYGLDDTALPAEGVISLAQTLTELFNAPGFVSHEFYEALWAKHVVGATNGG